MPCIVSLDIPLGHAYLLREFYLDIIYRQMQWYPLWPLCYYTLGSFTLPHLVPALKEANNTPDVCSLYGYVIPITLCLFLCKHCNFIRSMFRYGRYQTSVPTSLRTNCLNIWQLSLQFSLGVLIPVRFQFADITSHSYHFSWCNPNTCSQ